MTSSSAAGAKQTDNQDSEPQKSAHSKLSVKSGASLPQRPSASKEDATRQKKHPRLHVFFTQTLPKILNIIVLLLSFGLIAFISWDTYKGKDFLNNTIYMKYQFIVCMIFIAEYVYRFFITKNPVKFFILTLPYIFISIPYLNLIQYYGYYVAPETLYYLRFIPVLRGLIALVVVVIFVSKNLARTLFASYVLVLVPFVYMSGLFFYVAEKSINPGIKNFWYALWWAGMNVTTIGCDINPMTATGMILGLVLSLLGIMMFPLFTVYLGDMIQSFDKKEKTDH